MILKWYYDINHFKTLRKDNNYKNDNIFVTWLHWSNA